MRPIEAFRNLRRRIGSIPRPSAGELNEAMRHTESILLHPNSYDARAEPQSPKDDKNTSPTIPFKLH